MYPISKKLKVLDYEIQNRSQVFACQDLTVNIFDSFSLKEGLKAREVCREWEVVSTRYYFNKFSCGLGQKLAPYLACIKKTYAEYLSIKGIYPSKPSIINIFNHLVPIKCQASLGRCWSFADVAQINQKSLEQGIRDHSEDDFWLIGLCFFVESVGYPMDSQLRSLLRKGACGNLDSEEEVSKNKQVLELCLPALPKIEELIKKTGGVPYITLCELDSCPLSEEAKEAGLSSWSFAPREGDLNNGQDDLIAYFIKEKCSCGSFPSSFFDFREETDILGRRGLSAEHVMGRSFCFPIDGKLCEFQICPQPPELVNEESLDGSDDGPVEIESESGYRLVEYDEWFLLFSHPYIPIDEFPREESYSDSKIEQDSA